MSPLLKPETDIRVREFADIPAAIASIHRGDVIAYTWPPDTMKRFVHRLVGIPGDTLAMVRGVLQVNGRTHPEPYAWREGSGSDSANKDLRWQRKYALVADTSAYDPGRADWGPLAIPAGFFFVLGDNRDNSLDSRWWGLVPVANLRGVVQVK